MVSQLRGVAYFLFRMGKEESDDESAAIFEDQGLLLTEMANQLSVPPGYAPWQVKAHINLSALVDGPISEANFSENGRASIEDIISEAWEGIERDDTSCFARALNNIAVVAGGEDNGAIWKDTSFWKYLALAAFSLGRDDED